MIGHINPDFSWPQMAQMHEFEQGALFVRIIGVIGRFLDSPFPFYLEVATIGP
jgi:hypothetical protein